MSTQKYKEPSGFRGYIFSRSINGNFIPQRVQNLVIKDFANRKNLFFKLSSTEYIMNDCYLMLNALIKELKSLQGVIFYSFEMLPASKKKREELIKKILLKKKILYFALEEIKISNIKDFKKLNTILKLKSETDKVKNLKL